MLTSNNVFELSHQGYALLANTEKNNGRVLRRFLQRTCPQGQVQQVFAEYGNSLTASELRVTVEVARSVAIRNAMFLTPETRASEIGTIHDDMFNVVMNAYQLPHSLETASVRQLRSMLMDVVVLCDNLHRWAANPAANIRDADEGFFEHNWDSPPDVTRIREDFDAQRSKAVN